MARRRSGGSAADAVVGGVMLVGAGGLVLLAVLVVALVWATKLVVTFAAPTLLAVLGYVWLRHRSVPTMPPTLPNASDYDSPIVADHVGQLLMLRRMLHETIETQQALGDELALLRPQNGLRFDRRTKRGREINQRLDTAEQQLGDVERMIGESRYGVAAEFPDWLSSHQAWVHRRAAVQAAEWAGIVTLVALGVLGVVAVANTSWIIVLSRWVLWPGFAYPAGTVFAFGGLAGLISFAIAFFVNRRRLDRADPDQLAAWMQLSARWVSSVGWERYFDVPDSPASLSEEEHVDADWAGVLGIAGDASVDEIKQAYRESVQQYHPDRVATLGPKLQELAKSEMQRLNAAYATARTERGF